MRKQNNMTLKNLSEKINLSVSFLSGIERNMYSPSLETVSSLSDFFKITISEILGEENKHKVRVIKKDERKTFVSDDNKMKLEFLSKPGTMDSKLEIKVIELCPMLKDEKLNNSHQGEEVIHVMEGRIQVNIGGQVFEIEKGDTVHFDSSIMHGFENITKKPAKLLIGTSPPHFAPLAMETRKY